MIDIIFNILSHNNLSLNFLKWSQLFSSNHIISTLIILFSPSHTFWHTSIIQVWVRLLIPFWTSSLEDNYCIKSEPNQPQIELQGSTLRIHSRLQFPLSHKFFIFVPRLEVQSQAPSNPPLSFHHRKKITALNRSQIDQKYNFKEPHSKITQRL